MDQFATDNVENRFVNKSWTKGLKNKLLENKKKLLKLKYINSFLHKFHLKRTIGDIITMTTVFILIPFVDK